MKVEIRGKIKELDIEEERLCETCGENLSYQEIKAHEHMVLDSITDFYCSDCAGMVDESDYSLIIKEEEEDE